MKLKSKSRGKLVGLSSFIAVFALLATAVFCPFDGNNVEAATRSSRLRIDFVVREALSTGRLKIDFFLTKSGDFDYESIAKQLGIDFVVKERTNLGISGLGNATGGKLSSETSVDSNGNAVVVGSADFKAGTNASDLFVGVSATGDGKMAYSASTDETIGGTAGFDSPIELLGKTAVSTDGMGSNQWGYNVTQGSLVPDVATLNYAGVVQEKYARGDHVFKLNYAAKVKLSSLASGTYTGSVGVNVAVTADALTVHTDAIQMIDDAVEAYLDENPEEKARFEEAQAKAKAEYEARMNGGAVEEEL